MELLITCEHGGNNIPDKYKKLFKSQSTKVNSHRGYDPGALELAKLIHENIDSKFVYSTTSRLLVELNRSLHHHNLFSSVTKQLTPSEKEEIIKHYYMPYRTKVERYINSIILNDKLLHLSIHSFTPELKGIKRNADIGLLYDPKHKYEKDYCRKLKESLKLVNPDYKIRFNYPYLGTMDGFTKYLRKKFSPKFYSGIEIEVNQKYFSISTKQKSVIQQHIVEAIKLSLKN